MIYRITTGAAWAPAAPPGVTARRQPAKQRNGQLLAARQPVHERGSAPQRRRRAPAAGRQERRQSCACRCRRLEESEVFSLHAGSTNGPATLSTAHEYRSWRRHAGAPGDLPSVDTSCPAASDADDAAPEDSPAEAYGFEAAGQQHAVQAAAEQQQQQQREQRREQQQLAQQTAAGAAASPQELEPAGDVAGSSARQPAWLAWLRGVARWQLPTVPWALNTTLTLMMLWLVLFWFAAYSLVPALLRWAGVSAGSGATQALRHLVLDSIMVGATLLLLRRGLRDHAPRRLGLFAAPLRPLRRWLPAVLAGAATFPLVDWVHKRMVDLLALEQVVARWALGGGAGGGRRQRRRWLWCCTGSEGVWLTGCLAGQGLTRWVCICTCRTFLT